ncbi:Hypothetical protein HDN1F_26630 [gamma proteobacterium HdN1]|nr:Hypothetical protein HDN1F_26630 [gamma proteobacterium HdN1]
MVFFNFGRSLIKATVFHSNLPHYSQSAFGTHSPRMESSRLSRASEAWGKKFMQVIKNSGIFLGAILAVSLTGCMSAPPPPAPEPEPVAAPAQPAPESVTITGDSILFESSQSNVSRKGMPFIRKVADVLNAYPRSSISIEGHTDNMGEANYNQKLSEARANSVMNALNKAGVESSRMSATGFGMSKPLVENTSSSNRRTNRRVEIVVTGVDAPMIREAIQNPIP